MSSVVFTWSNCPKAHMTMTFHATFIDFKQSCIFLQDFLFHFAIDFSALLTTVINQQRFITKTFNTVHSWNGASI